MPDLEKIMSVDSADIEKIMGVARADIEEIMGVTMPSLSVPWFGSRHILMGWDAPSDLISYKSSTSSGNTAEFGDLVYGRGDPRGAGTGVDKARGVAGSAYSASLAGFIDDYDYIACGTTANAQDGGDLVPNASSGAGASNGTLMFFMGGGSDESPSRVDHMDYITIASLGNSTDAGDIQDGLSLISGVSGDTRGAAIGGQTGDSADGYTNYTTAQTSFIVYHTSNNAADFGDLNQKNFYGSATQSQTRWVQKAGGNYTSAGGQVNFTALEFYTAATEATAGAFGDISGVGRYTSALSDGTRGEWWGGNDTSNNKIDNIYYVAMATEGDGTDAGNMHDGVGISGDAGLSGAAS